MSREKALTKNVFIIGLGTFLPRLSMVIVLPILTGYLTKTEFGTFDLINTLVLLLLPIVTLRIETAAFRFLLECKDINEKKNIVTTMLVYGITISILALVIFYVLATEINILTRAMISLFFFLDTIHVLTLQIVRGFSKNMVFSISAIINSLIKMSLIVLLVSMLNIGLNGVLIATNVAFVISIAVNIIGGSIYKYISHKSFSLGKLKSMLQYSWPMVPNSLSYWAMNFSSRLIITAILGIEANAIYAVANRIPGLFGSVKLAFGFAWQENASLAVKDSDAGEYYGKMFDHVFRIFFGLIILLIAATPVLFFVLIRGNYTEAYYQMPFLFGAFFFSSISSFLGGIYVAHKRTLNFGVTTVFAALLSVIINFGLIHVIGLFAASISTLVGFAFLTIYRMINIKSFQKIDYKYKTIFLCLGIFAGMGWLLYLNNMVASIINIVVGVFVSIAFNYKTLREVLKKVKRK